MKLKTIHYVIIIIAIILVSITAYFIVTQSMQNQDAPQAEVEEETEDSNPDFEHNGPDSPPHSEGPDGPPPM